MKAKAAVFMGAKKPFEVREFDVVAPPEGYGRCRLIASGVCGTDLHIWRGLLDAPAPSADSRMARRSTCVEPQGTQMMIRGDGRKNLELCTIRINCLSICSVTVKSAITPSFIGRIASILPGTLPNICLASLPTA